MTAQPTLKFHDGHSIPQLGFGVWQVPPETTADVVSKAIAAGYRLVDTAAGYGNEAGVGEAIAASGLDRADIFLTTKLANVDHGYDNAFKALEESLDKLGTDYVDLYLIHWPRPAIGVFRETWKAMVKLKGEGRARSIGVSNFTAAHIDAITADTGEKPVLNQIELHPRFQQRKMRAYDTSQDIVTQSWSPLGRGKITENAVLSEIGAQYGKTWAQVVIRWHLQIGLSLIPRSVTPHRIKSNFDVIDFELSAADMAKIAALDAADGRDGPDPDTMNRD
jgi:2,5-diketo-D-gluconate reductase A